MFRTETVHSATVFYGIGVVDYPLSLLNCMGGGLQGRYKKQGNALGTYNLVFFLVRTPFLTER
jgi:hypothetical protein